MENPSTPPKGRIQVHLPPISPGEKSTDSPTASPCPQSFCRRPNQLGDMGTPTRTRRPFFDLPGTNLTPPKTPDNNVVEKKMAEIVKLSGILNIQGVKYKTEMEDLKDLGQLGNGTSGQVVKMLHIPSQEVIAVKQMRRSGNMEENKRIAMDLEVVLKSLDCPYIVQCLGCFITNSEVWICMELMSTCFDKLLKRLQKPIPERVVGKVAVATVEALNYLKETHGVIHRDVKPSNILLDERGKVKLCDFGISGQLVNSRANTKNAGCTAYLAPERINPPDPKMPFYDIRADVWSLGITLVELATGSYPYPSCESDFEVLSRVLQDDPPCLPDNGDYTPEFRDFVKACLAKDYEKRPKYRELLRHSFLIRYGKENVDVAGWFATTSPPPSPTNYKRKYSSPVKEDEKEEEGAGSEAGGSHQRSLSEVDASGHHQYAEEQRSGFFSLNFIIRGLMRSPLMSRKRSTGNTPSSPLLQRFYNSQNHRSNTSRSASVSPIRNMKLSTVDSSEPVGSPSTRKKLSSYFPKFGLGCREPRPSPADCGEGAPPQPPPRLNRNASPLVLRRINANFPIEAGRRNHAEASPSLSRRYVSPSPPQPPPRRLLESTSVPSSPFHVHHHPLHHHHPNPIATNSEGGNPRA